MKYMYIIPVAALALSTACGEDDDAIDGGIPPKPSLGNLVDRNGRAGITTALVQVLAPVAARGAARDAYNQAARSDWTSATIVDDIRANLAVYDSLDTVCGNQLIADADASARYSALASALADDRLYVNLAGQSCGQYFGVELNATGVAQNTDCGGRRPNDDVIDVTYSALAIGAVSGVEDGVSADGDVNHNQAVFPWLSGPVTSPPVRPNLGTLVDRNGRAGITTALIQVLADSTPRGAARDTYNQTEIAGWQSSAIVDDIQANLAVYDSLDGVCGNQLLADTDPNVRYSVLAGALADDRLYVNVAGTTCSQYFGVELSATGVLANTDCGGRRPVDDVIDVTYSALAIGGVAGVGDGVTSDVDADQSSAQFPFLAAPGSM